MGIIAKCRFNQQDTNLYYYPDVEEIHVGFEYQSCHSLSYDNSFSEKEVIEYKIPGGYKDDIADLIAMMDDGYGEVRVPLLTKEQIEKEGWNTKYGVEDFARYFEVKGLIYKLSWEYWVDGPHIQIWDTNFAECVYKGFCPTINHLKTIMRLLNIK